MESGKLVAWFWTLGVSLCVGACGVGEFSASDRGAFAAGGGGTSAGAGAGSSGQAGAGASGGASGGAASGSGGAEMGGSSAGLGAGAFAGASLPPVASCAEACAGDGDCRVAGVDQGYRCNLTALRCERFASPCRADLECLPEGSLWLTACVADADCVVFDDDVCVDAGGVGRCARLAPGGLGAASGCEFPAADAISVQKFGDATAVIVCANTARVCDRGECRTACRSDAECGADRNGTICDLPSGTCRCVRNEDCGGPGVSVCDRVTGFCLCENAADCTDVPNTDACLGGQCGCSAASACNGERAFSGTSYVCQ